MSQKYGTSQSFPKKRHPDLSLGYMNLSHLSFPRSYTNKTAFERQFSTTKGQIQTYFSGVVSRKKVAGISFVRNCS